MNQDLIRRRSRRVAWVLAAAAGASVGIGVSAALGQNTYYYLGEGANNNWSNPVNWTLGAVPGSSDSGDSATVGGSSLYGNVTINYDYSYNASTAGPYASINTLNQLIIDGPENGGSVVFQQSQGTSVMDAGNEFVGASTPNPAFYIQTAGVNVAQNGLVVANGLTSPGAGYPTAGTYELQGGTLIAGNESVGVIGTGSFIQSGGTNTVGSAGGFGLGNLAYFTVAQSASSSYAVNNAGTYILNANAATGTSTLTVYGDEVIGDGNVYSELANTVSAVGTFNQSASTVNTISRNLSIGLNVNAVGTYLLSGGAADGWGQRNHRQLRAGRFQPERWYPYHQRQPLYGGHQRKRGNLHSHRWCSLGKL